MKFLKLVSILTVIALVLTLMPAVALAQEPTGDTATGQFQCGNSAPENLTVELWITGGSPDTTTHSMSPWVEFNAKVTVSDANTLDDLSTVTVKIFYDADGIYAPGDLPASGHFQTAAILTWTNANPNTWAIDAGTTTQWALGTCVEPTLSAGSGTFEFLFKIGKVATETTGSAKWHIWAQANDGSATDDGTWVDNTMSWYGEITVNTGSVSWGSVAPGTDFGDSTKQTGISVNYISNGAYQEQVAASSPWTGSSYSAALDPDGTPAANEFSLKADDTATLPADGLVPIESNYVTIDTPNAQTDESGDTVTTNTLWLKLGSPFNDATYNGTIYFKIAND